MDMALADTSATYLRTTEKLGLDALLWIRFRSGTFLTGQIRPFLPTKFAPVPYSLCNFILRYIKMKTFELDNIRYMFLKIILESFQSLTLAFSCT
jgi:hypothetical protein